jgi:precorrin-4/cobalt-precorrin-4 C11-methyltransferase
MKVYFVGAGPGDPELLTVRADHLLRTAKCCIYAGSLVSPEIIDLIPPDAEKHDSARMTLDEVIAVVQAASARDDDVVRLHTGEPAIYGAIGEQMDALDEIQIGYEVVPGVSSFQAAAAAIPAELTAPEISQTVILTRLAGRTPVPEQQDLARLAEAKATLCLFLSVDKIAQVATTLTEHYGENCPATVVYRASWPDQEVIQGELCDIASKVHAAGITKTAIILVGRALKRPYAHRSKLYDKTFSHAYREGQEE